VQSTSQSSPQTSQNTAYSAVIKGNEYYSKDEYDKAIAEYTRAVQLDSNYEYAYFGRGNSYYMKRDYDKAIADYEAALRINPNYADAKTWLANARQARGDTFTFPSGFVGKWKRDNFNNTLTFTNTTLKSSSQDFSWILTRISGDTYINKTDDTGYVSASGITIKLINGNLVISGDSGDGQDNWNGTWKKQ
jgi:tetratricopeptide (TPR) repeat protein